MTRPMTIAVLAFLLAIPIFSTGSVPVPAHAPSPRPQISRANGKLHRSAPCARKPSSSAKVMISETSRAGSEGEPVLVILYDVRPGSWM